MSRHAPVIRCRRCGREEALAYTVGTADGGYRRVLLGIYMPEHLRPTGFTGRTQQREVICEGAGQPAVALSWAVEHTAEIVREYGELTAAGVDLACVQHDKDAVYLSAEPSRRYMAAHARVAHAIAAELATIGQRPRREVVA